MDEIQTIGILALAIGVLTKLLADTWRSWQARRNGNPGPEAQLEKVLERWSARQEDRELKELVRDLIRVVQRLCELMESRPCMARREKENVST